MAGTFISYRREDAAGYAGRLRESLERRIGAHRVFRDVDALLPGQDFVQAIEARLAECRVMLAVIGREWVDARSASGNRRLEDPYDFVRLEIAAALVRPDVLVVPVLVENATMPGAADLPENIRPLARRHAVSVRDETWDADIDRLVGVIDTTETTSASPRHASPGLQPRAWVAAGIAVLIVALLAFNQMRAGRTDGTADPGTPGGSAGTGSPAGPSATAFAAYTIDMPRIAEAAFGDLIYTAVSANVASRGDANELRVRVRLMNFGRYDANFWDSSFRLVAGSDIVSPTGDLNQVVPGNSLRYGVVTFRLPPRTQKATFRIVSAQAAADIPLDVSPTGRPAVDEQAEVADSSSQAITATVSRDPMPLIDAGDMNVILFGASTRRFANTLRLALEIRVTNRGRYPLSSGALTMRAAFGGELQAPSEFPNLAVDPMSTASGTVRFDLPTSTTKMTLRSTIGSQTSDLPLELR